MTNTPARGLRSLALIPLLVACATERAELPSEPVFLHPLFATAERERFSDWSEPVNLGPNVNAAATEIELSISRDGLSMYVASNRPGGFGGFDIWVSRRAGLDDAWGPLTNLGPTINTAAREQGPFLSIDGHRLFFFSDRPGGAGGTDLYVSRRRDTRDDFAWRAPDNLGGGVNSSANETLPVYFNGDEGAPVTLYYSSNRPGSAAGDIYASTLDADGSFGPASPVVELNSARRDRVLAIARDGLELFLASDRPGPIPTLFDLWVATRGSTSAPWSAPVKLGPGVNTEADEGGAALSFDASTLYIASDRSGGFGSLDVWVSTRSRIKGANGID